MLAHRCPGAEFFTVVGDDAAANITTWERYDEVAARSAVGGDRPPGAPVELPDGFDWVRVEAGLEVSSTDLRARVRDGCRLLPRDCRAAPRARAGDLYQEAE